jgi:uncharacterized protein with FMN-binding domain
MLKKIILTGFVLLTFVIYSVHERSATSVVSVKVADNSEPTVQPTPTTTSDTPAITTTSAPATIAAYKDGSYTGQQADAFYGYIQVRAIVSGGQLTDVTFLQYPNDQRNSVEINSQAMPLLKQQALKVQSAQVDGVSGATDTSQAFIQSLGDALQQAKA